MKQRTLLGLNYWDPSASPAILIRLAQTNLQTIAKPGQRISGSTLRYELVDDVFDELNYRQTTLKDAYPFEVDLARRTLTFKGLPAEDHAGPLAYLFCLLASAIREKRLAPKVAFADLALEIGNLFQICACLFESLLNGRAAAGVDINPVAACIAGAKADPPTLKQAIRRLDNLKEEMSEGEDISVPRTAFFKACFHRSTLREIAFLRMRLRWTTSKVDRFIAAILLGCLHGESHKSKLCLSNRMPRTISTKPDYSVRWWQERELVAPERRVFDILKELLAFRLSQPVPVVRGVVKRRDAREAYKAFPTLTERVNLIVTSPPYLDTTDYSEDQWLRLWFLGGEVRPAVRRNSDDRHTNIESYWRFLSEAWAGCEPLLKSGAVFVVRIGGTRFSKSLLRDGLRSSLREGLPSCSVRALHDGHTSAIKNSQTNVFRPGSIGKRYEHDFVFRVT